MILLNKYSPFFFTFLLSAVLIFIFREDVFMWDNVIIPSATASFFYYKGFHIFSMGSFLDCGHPPLISLYLTGCWKLFGRNLWVSHATQLPFLWLLFHQFFIVSKKLFSSEIKQLALVFAAVLFFADTTIVSQLAQVGYEIPMIAFWLLAVNLYWKKISEPTNYSGLQNCLLYCSIILLPFIQLRSLPLLITFAIGNLMYQFFQPNFSIKKIIQSLLPFIISAFIFCSWLLIHLQKTGYLISDPNGYWGKENVGIASLHQMIKNAGIVTIRFYDNGHFLSVLMMIVVLVYFFNHFNFKNKNYYSFLLWIWLVTTVGLSFNFMVMSKPICHRYFLPSIILVPFFLSHFITTQMQNFKWMALVIFASVLISGTFILPLKKFGIGWDSNLAHLPYQKLRSEAFDYLQKNKISNSDCATRFPFDVADSLINLQSTPIHLVSLSESSLEKYEYILQSNVATSFTPSQFSTLSKKYKVEKMWNKGLVEIRLYKKVH